ncbi:MAG TPA: hypothetical protein ENJ18_02525, partial [Nannocystis exedens]|nr:hypothetical protein [Nannocystis exedens]
MLRDPSNSRLPTFKTPRTFAMTIKDISRHLLQPEKHYSGLRLQQGRIILDSDFNESAMIAGEDQRLVVADVVGPHGSSDDGFKVASVSLIDYDFTIVAGSYYVGGLRLVLGADETFLAQQDWLQSSRSDVSLPTLPNVLRDDLLYMVAWEQEVSGVEDQEIVEQALGGPDTSVRVRRMRRVYAHTSAPADCSDAFADLKTSLTKAGLHTFDERTGELISAALLKVGPSNSGAIQDLCQSPGKSGYIGAENQAIRIQLIDTNRFIWSYDNASPLYRISLPAEVDTDVYELAFITPPKDQAHHPLMDEVLEILPWGASLPNGEVAADHSIAADIGGGLFARVKSPYNPITNTVEVSLIGADLQPFVEWLELNAPPEDRFLFLRHWRPGDAGGTTGLHFDPDIPVELVGSGLQVTFTNEGIIGDTWIITARPSTPEIVLPWDLDEFKSGAPPHAPRRFYAPLAMLHWAIVDDQLGVSVESCRRTFRSLTEQGGCCTVTVGDGDQSFGDYRTISDALAALPPAGGKVCVLPGIYDERIVLTDRSDITIEGCESRTIIRTPADNNTSEGLLTLTGCQRITIRSLAIEATAQIGILLMPDVAGQQGPITLHDLAITTQRDPTQNDDPDATKLWIQNGPAEFPCPTIAAYQLAGLEICRCDLTMIGHLSAMANVLLRNTSLGLIRDSSIITVPPPGPNSITTAWGGLQLAGGCQDIEVIHNEI